MQESPDGLATALADDAGDAAEVQQPLEPAGIDHLQQFVIAGNECDIRFEGRQETPLAMCGPGWIGIGEPRPSALKLDFRFGANAVN